ncbi:MAG TPA: NAD(P)H-binding protein [Anaeromyxobacter sp.]|nr:NAD(P)H-binding protein [Anaeromyxobacter sp.]
MIAVTAATGHLGRLVLEELLQKVPAGQVIAAVRNPDKAKDLVARGVEVRTADYDQPATLDAALQGAEKLLFISGSEAGKRGPQHRAVVDAARRAGVKLVAYTSILHADTTPLALAAEHKETEAALHASGLPVVLLRNSWYTENYTERLGPVLQRGVVLGAAGEGRVAAAARADYAAAAAAVLTTPGHEGKVYELAGDAPFTLA